MILSNGLTDAGFPCNKFTWTNNRLGPAKIVGRLDRDLINTKLITSLVAKVSHLSRNCSDHAPLLIDVFAPVSKKSAFRFINAWTRHNGFMDLVKEAWDIDISARPLVKFSQKLKNLRSRVRS